jgi:hypothetical protein
MASELSMNGKKKIETLQKEFTQKFAYLTLVFLDKERRAIDISKSLSEVRQAKGDDISIIASLKVNTLEKRFLENFGIIVEVAYQKSDKVVYTKDNVDKTLNELNKWCEENDCQPFEFKKSFTGNTLSSVQEQLFEAIKAHYPNSEAKKINKDNYLDIYVPELNKKRGTHLFFNTAKDGIKIGFYCRDEDFIENVLSKSSNIEKYAQGIRILENPLQNDVEEATRSALNFIKEIIGEQNNNSTGNLISKLIGDFTETFDLNDYLGYNLTERPGKMSVYEVSSNQMELALESKELDFEFEFKGCVDLNDWDALSGIIGKKESLENKKEYSKETINQSGNINFLYCEGTYVYSVLNPGDSEDVVSNLDDEEVDLDQILKDLGYEGDDEGSEDENEVEDNEDYELDEQNFELIKALEVYDSETTVMVQMFSQFGITEVGNGIGSWEGNNYTYDYRTEWNEGYLEEFEAISVESLIELLKTKNINEFTQVDFGSLGAGTLRGGNTTYENFKWASEVNKKDIKNAPDEEELCGDGDKQDCEYEWTSPERIEFVVTEDDKEELTFTLINNNHIVTDSDNNDEDTDSEEFSLSTFDIDDLALIKKACAKIENEKVLTGFIYVSQKLAELGFEMDGRNPFFFTSLVHVSDNELSGFLYVNMDGFYSNCVNEKEIQMIFSWDSVIDIKIIEEDGDSIKFNLYSSEGGLTISEPYSKNTLILLSIYKKIWKDVVERFKSEEVIQWSIIEGEMGVSLYSFDDHEEYIEWIE